MYNYTFGTTAIFLTLSNSTESLSISAVVCNTYICNHPINSYQDFSNLVQLGIQALCLVDRNPIHTKHTKPFIMNL